MVDACGAQDADHNETDGTETLDEDLGVEVHKTRRLCALESMYANASELEDHSLLQVKLVDYEVGRDLATDEKVSCKPAVKRLCIVVTDKTEHALLITKVGVGRMVTADMS